MTQLMTDPDVGIELHNVVHGDQRFEQKRPIRAGDELTGTITIDTLRAAAGMDMIGTRTEISTVDGEHVATAFATLVHRGWCVMTFEAGQELERRSRTSSPGRPDPLCRRLRRLQPDPLERPGRHVGRRCPA